MTKATDTRLRHPQHIIGDSARQKARNAYRAAWDRNWPFDERYLAELFIEAKASLGLEPNSKKSPDQVLGLVLDLMRADHEFGPD
jgi:hypothetical protein